VKKNPEIQKTFGWPLSIQSSSIFSLALKSLMYDIKGFLEGYERVFHKSGTPLLLIEIKTFSMSAVIRILPSKVFINV